MCVHALRYVCENSWNGFLSYSIPSSYWWVLRLKWTILPIVEVKSKLLRLEHLNTFFTLGGDHSNLSLDGPIWTSLKIFVSVFHSLSSSSTLSLLILSPCPQSLSPFYAQLSRPNPSRLRQSKAFLPSATFSRWLILIILESNRPSKSFCNSALYYAAR